VANPEVKMAMAGVGIHPLTLRRRSSERQMGRIHEEYIQRGNQGVKRETLFSEKGERASFC
jgi:hypothetical protein